MNGSRMQQLVAALAGITPGSWLLLAIVLLYPLFSSPFFAYQISAYSLLLGTVALSLMMLAGYGGMVSLAQLTAAGVAGYLVAILGVNSTGVMGLGWPWWLTECRQRSSAPCCSARLSVPFRCVPKASTPS